MGRPIKKKFFGNTNLNSPTTPTDDYIGGEGVASVTITDPGSYTSALPSVSFPVPSIPLGVQAEGTVQGKAVQIYSFSNTGNNYTIGETLSVNGGTFTQQAELEITSLVVKSVTLTNGGSLYDNDNEIWFDSAINSAWTTPLKLDVTGNTAGLLTTFDVLQYGVWTSANAAPTTVTCTTANTRGGADQNATGAVFDLVWGVNTANISVAGKYSTVSSNPHTTVSTGSGTGATVNMRWGVDSVIMDVNGSGYVDATDAAPTFTSGSVTATGTSVMQTLQDNAIIAIDVSTGDIVDIVKQESSDSFWVQASSGVPYLLSLVAPTASSGLYIRGTDSWGATYWLAKIMSHKAVVGGVVSGGAQWSINDSPVWSLDAPVEGYSITIRNA